MAVEQNNKKVMLITDDVQISRVILRNIFEGEYQVIEAENGAEALEILNSRDDITVLLLDIKMPVLDGFGVLEAMKHSDALRLIPAIIITACDDEDTQIDGLIAGATDVLTKPFNSKLILHRVRNIVARNESARLIEQSKRMERELQLARYDLLTGLFNRESFFAETEKLVALQAPGYYAITSFDIDSFKVINDQYGTEKGDAVLRYIANILKNGFCAVGGIASRITGDTFAVLYPKDFIDTKELERIRTTLRVLDPTLPMLTFSAGRYLVDDKSLSAGFMYERASIARLSVKGRYGISIAQYDETMRAKILHEQRIVNEMSNALLSGQFELMLQPIFNYASKGIVGAEALVRWNHPEQGMIAPNSFIPVFERNGFIYDMDKYVWEQVALLLRKWINRGENPLPISVNVSRFDLLQADFYSVFTSIVEKYCIPTNLIRVEITESAFSQTNVHVIDIVKKLQSYGLIVEIDDFGSGYSSLNTLKDVEADVLKLDMGFLENTENTRRSGNILESIIRMAKWLKMSVIAEGVSKTEQADFLQSIGCAYMQGYYFEKPLSINAYEKLMRVGTKDPNITSMETIHEMDRDAFWSPESTETLVFSNYVGGACVIELTNDRCELIRVNERYLAALNTNLSADELLRHDPLSTIGEKDHAAIKKQLSEHTALGSEFTGTTLVKMYFDTPVHEEYLRYTARIIANTKSSIIIYMLVENVTEQMLTKQNNTDMSAQLQAILDNTNNGIFLAKTENGNLSELMYANDRYYEMQGFTRNEWETEEIDFVSNIHPSDRERVLGGIHAICSDPTLKITDTFAVKGRDCTYIWVQSYMSAVEITSNDKPIILGIITDITKDRENEIQSHAASEQISAIMKNVSCGICASYIDDLGSRRILFANDRYYDILGYTKEQYDAEVKNVDDYIRLDGDLSVSELYISVRDSDVAHNVEYNCIKRNGDCIRVSGSISVCNFVNFDFPVLLDVLDDVTARFDAENNVNETSAQLQFLNEIAQSLLMENDTDSAIHKVIARILDYFDGEHAYVCEFDNDEYPISTYEVFADISNKRMFTSNYSFSFWNDIFVGNKHIVTINDSTTNMSFSTTAVALMRNEKLFGVICIDDPKRNQTHMDRLEVLGDYIAVMLTKQDMSNQIEKDNEAMLTLINDIPGGFLRIHINRDGSANVVIVSDGYCKLIGLTKSDVQNALKANPSAFIYPDDTEKALEFFKVVMETDSLVNAQYRLIAANGEHIDVAVFARSKRNRDGSRDINVFYANVLGK